MIVRLLGPVEVVGPSGRAMLSGRQRALVGLLALRTGTVLLPARVVDGLWGEDPPRTAIKSLHSHIARVRQALCACGLTDVLRTKGSGYAFEVARAEVDVCRFEDRVRSARDDLTRGRWAEAVQRLREGLALWAGDPVQDGELAGWGLAEVTRLREVRLSALEDLWDAELRLGHHASAAGELDRLLVQHPLRERLVELQMLALYRTGRRLDALEAFGRLRARLAEELGVDPTPELQRLHTAILRHDADLGHSPPPGDVATADAPVPRPAQLPPRVGHFTGRDGELRALDRLRVSGGDTRIVVISGRGGMGKTALAIQWAHRVKDGFPDGQLFLDLRGRDAGGAMTPADALGRMVRALGVPGEKVPDDVTELTGLYRSLLDGKRILVVLDNASTVDQVRPLVPATTASVLVVTARKPMTALATYHAVEALRLDALGEADALALLGGVIGPGRVRSAPADAVAIVDACGRMPLALRIAAAKLAGEPGRPIGELAAELSGEHPLDALSVDGDSRSVRTVFASAYRALPAPAARLFRLLGLHPGGTFGRELAASLLASDVDGAMAGSRAASDVDVAVVGSPSASDVDGTMAGSPLASDVDGVLAELADAYLIAEVGGGRYRFHDLIQLYAGECAHREESQTERSLAAERILDWYLGVAEAGNRVLDPGRDRVRPLLSHPPQALPFGSEPQEVLAFLDAERENLPAVVGFAAEQGRLSAAWQLTYLLTGFFDSRGQRPDRVEICRLGLAAAQRQGDAAAEGMMRSALGVAYILSRRFDAALDCLYPALESARAEGDRRREAFCANSIATAYAGLRRFGEAHEAYLRALRLHRETGNRLGIALTLNNIGVARIRLGQGALSFEHLLPALRLSQEIEHPRIEAGVLFSLGEAYLCEGRLTQALAHFGNALEIRRAIGDRRNEVDTLNHIGVTWLAQGDPVAAEENIRRALALGHELADPHLISVCLTHLATAQTRRGDLEAAHRHLRSALSLRTRVPDLFEEAVIHRAFAVVAERAGRPVAALEHREQAARLFLKANAPGEAAGLTGS